LFFSWLLLSFFNHCLPSSFPFSCPFPFSCSCVFSCYFPFTNSFPSSYSCSFRSLSGPPRYYSATSDKMKWRQVG
jgi:hypothetical protein